MRSPKLLDTDEIDLALDTASGNPGINDRHCMRKNSCAARRGHPAMNKQIALDQFASHLLMSPKGDLAGWSIKH